MEDKKVVVIREDDSTTFERKVQHYLENGYEVSSTNCSALIRKSQTSYNVYREVYQAILIKKEAR